MGAAAQLKAQNIDYRFLFLYALPLAISGLFMTLEQPVVSAGIARSGDPETELAAYGVAVALAVWLEAPIFMLLDAATARCVDRHSYRVLRRYTLLWCVIIVVVTAAIAFTPLNRFVFGSLLGLSDQVADEAVVAVALFLPWPPMIAWRRLHQGLLIRQGHTRVIGLAVGLRLATAVLLTGLGIATSFLEGAALGAVTLTMGVTVEAVAIHLFARRVVRQELVESVDVPERIESLSGFNRYYLPLIGTAVFFFLTSPVIAAGLARSAEATRSLAAWPVAYSMVLTMGSPLEVLQQVAIRFGIEPHIAARARRFLIGSGLALTGLLLLFNLTGVTRFVLSRLIGVEGDVFDAASMAVWLTTPVPLLMGVLSLSRGILVRVGQTGTVQRGATANLLILVVIMLGLTRVLDWPGYVLAGLAMVLAMSCEALVLSRRAVSRLRSIAPTESKAAPSL